MSEPNKDDPSQQPTRCENCMVDFHEDRDGDCNCPRRCSDCDKDICDVCSYGGLCKDCSVYRADMEDAKGSYIPQLEKRLKDEKAHGVE